MVGKKIVRMIILTGTVMMLVVPGIYAWSSKQAPIMTQWASQVDPNNPLPEYPRPQMVRNNWLNLNGVWQFRSGAVGDGVPVGQTLSGEILVPFPVESALSGVMQHYDRLWYRRTFTVPSGWNGQRIILNFGAVDYESEVYINGKSLGIHKGGYDPFRYDITSYLSGIGIQELIVRVYDPTEAGGQPRGKQTTAPGGILYTPTTGIWQTVWIEPVPQTGINDIKIVPNIDNSTLKLTVNTAGSTTGISVAVQVIDSGIVVQTATGSPNTEMTIEVPNTKLWSPDNPFLYDLGISLVQNGTAVDSVTSYFGMRKISLGLVDGYQKMLLNNQFVFQIGPLDQGFWPDGIYTAPTDDALKYDLQQTKALGFNMVRKHIKVEPYRWYYWADKLGLLVWQDMPSGNSYGGVAVNPAAFEAELVKMVQTHWNSPCIIMWDIFNEGQGQQNTTNLVQEVLNLDPSRLVNPNSGGSDEGLGQVQDYHNYPSPVCPASTTRAVACGEYGGIGYQINGHIWSTNGNPYSNVTNATDYLNRYYDYMNSLTGYKTIHGLSAAVYTQITDVETELNGLMTYDRAVVKGDFNQINAANLQVRNKLLYVSDVLPTSQGQAQSWKYTTISPTSDWYTTGFSDSSWSTGNGGFGTSGTPGAVIGTTWNTSDIWLRKQFTLGSLNATDISNLVFKVYHDEACEIYINGVQAATAAGYTTSYTLSQITQAGRNALITNGANLIAIHCSQTTGGQGIDAGISKMVLQDYAAPWGSFSDNFTSDNAADWTVYGGNWAVTNGQYIVGTYNGAKAIVNNTSFANFTYEADLSISGGDAGLIFRVSNPSTGTDAYSGYYAGLNSTGYVVLGKASNNWTRLATSNMTLSANTIYHMKVTANGSNIQVFVDDMSNPKINATDFSFFSGAIGVRTFGSAAIFDNISVIPTAASKCTGGTIGVSSSASPSGEDATKTFDGSASTKWLIREPTGWIQYHFGGIAWAVNQYTITSANDYPARDPKDWTFQGSNDGTNWITLDTRSNESFSSRYLKKTYTFTNDTAYKIYRFLVTANSGDPYLQTAEIEMFAGTGVVFYKDDNFNGPASQVLGKGTYTMMQLSAMGVPNDWMTSLKVPSGWRVTVYQDWNFTGTSWIFTGDTGNVGSACNDQMSSCVIQ